MIVDQITKMKCKNATVMQFIVALLQLVLFLLPLSIGFYKINLLLLFFYTLLSAIYVRTSIFHPYILFLCTFFLFMLSRVFIDVVGGPSFAENNYYAYYTFSENVQYQILLLLSIALIFIHFGALFAFIKTKKYKNGYEKSIYLPTIKKISLLMFYCALIPFFIRILAVIGFVMENGYVALYVAEGDIITNPVLKISDDICALGFYLFLACFPSKKELKWPTTIYIGLLILSLGMGQRGPILTQVLVLFSYFGLRKMISKKMLVIAMFGMIILSQFAYTFRNRETNSSKSLGQSVQAFFSSQGVSIMIIGLSVEEKENLQDVSIFAPILHMMRNSPFAKIFGYQPIPGPSEEYAKHSRALGDVLSYKTNKELYINGYGVGGAMIADFYVWAGCFGVGLGCFLFLYFIIYLFERYKYSTYGMFLLFYMLPGFFFSPRSSPLMIVNDIMRPIIFLFLLQLILEFCKKKAFLKTINR